MITTLAGSAQSDLELIRDNNFSQPEFRKAHRHFLLADSTRSAFVRYNPISLTLSSALYLYQSVVSVQLSAECLYSPSCSRFSRKLIAGFGLVKGTLLSADRLLRCNRIAASDIHRSSIDANTGKSVETTAIYLDQRRPSDR